MSGRIVIAGAGVAGATAARTLRSGGYTGRIVLVGAEHHAPYRRPMVSKDLLAGARGIDRCLLEPESYWAQDDIDLRMATTVADIDTGRGRVRLSDGESLGYDSLLLATGARARRIGQHQPVRVRTLRGVADIGPLREAIETGPLLIIGAGLVASRSPRPPGGWAGRSISCMRASHRWIALCRRRSLRWCEVCTPNTRCGSMTR